MTTSQRRGPWVPEEDQDLLQLVQSQGPKNWVRISQHMRFRSPKQCRERFHQNLKPTLNHTPISAEEGIVIERMVNEMGRRWAEIARRLGNRSDNAVKNWWNASMNRKRRGLALPGGVHPSSRALNGRVEPPYPKVQASLRSPGGRPHFQPPGFDARRSPWVSPCESTLSNLGRVSNFAKNAGPADSDGKGESGLSVVGYNIGRQADWRREECLDRSSGRDRLAQIVAPPMHTVVTPLPSPTASVTSVAPSMVSDHNSISSASPRTASSPSILPIPRQVYGERRRGSAPNIPPLGPLDYSNGIRGKPMESLSETAVQRGWASDISTYRTGVRDSCQRWGHHHTSSAPQLPFGADSTQSLSRDVRMEWGTLLNDNN